MTTTIKTDDATWRKAQAAELNGWTGDWAGMSDDRPGDHIALFNNYAAVPRDCGDVLEIGCGPFTQTRHIINGRTFRSITLSDPLLSEYRARQPHCAYRDGKLLGVDVRLDARPAEELDYDAHFDTVILINVLEHVRDADAVMDAAYRALRVGGVLICGERIHTPGEELGCLLNQTLHPIRVPADFLDRHYARYTERMRNGGYFVGVK